MKVDNSTGVIGAVNRRRFSFGIPLLAASAAASQQALAAKDESSGKPIVTH